MHRTTKTTVALTLFLVLVVSPLAAASGGAAASNGGTITAVSEQNATDDTPDLEELRAGGEKPANAPPSIRASGTYSEFALKYLPTGILVREDNPNSWRYLERGTEVNRDTVQIWSKRGYGVDSQDLTVRVAHYVERQRTRDNETVRVAENVTTYSIDATVGGGYDKIPVDMRSHYQQTHETVICVEMPGEPNCLTNPNGVRWHLNHQTSEAMQGIDLDSEGDKLAWGLGYVLFPFLVSSLSFMFGARKAIDAAKSAPRIPWWVWPVILVGSVISLFGFWDQIVATTVRAPWSLSLVGGAIVGLVAAVWFGASRRRSMFFRLRPREWVDTAPPGDGNPGEVAADGGPEPAADGPTKPGRARSSLVADLIPIPMVHGPDGERYHVAKGFLNWLARARGAVAPLEADNHDTGGSLQTRIDVDRGPYEEMYFLHPKADDEEVLDYEPEGHDWSIPDIVWKDEDGWHVNLNLLASGGFVFGLTALLGEVLLASAKLGLLIAGVVIALWKFATPSQGKLQAKLANIHYIRALPTVINHAQDIADASTKEELFENWQNAEMDKRVDRQELEDRRDRTQSQQMVDRYLGEPDSTETTESAPEPAESPDPEAEADD